MRPSPPKNAPSSWNHLRLFSTPLIGWWYYLARRNDAAIAQALRTIEIAPNHFFAHWVLGLAYGRAQKFAEAISALQKAMTLTGGNQHIRGDLGRIYAASGQRDEALKVLEGLKEQAKSSYLSPVNLAKIYFGLGEREQVLEQLERACAEHSIKLPWFMIDPALDDLRTEPSFQSIVWRVGLPK